MPASAAARRSAVGEKLKRLRPSAQLLCITHLPQIASAADAHFRSRSRPATRR